MTVTVTEPTIPPITISPEALRDLRTNPLFARLTKREEDDSTGEKAGLVLAAGITAAVVVGGLVWLPRRRDPTPNEP